MEDEKHGKEQEKPHKHTEKRRRNMLQCLQSYERVTQAGTMKK